ncbi:MAG: NADH-quinone oxidoreductase subunit J [Candidatus Acidiferrales bacterium]
METVFYIAAVIAIVATILTITRLNPIHALLYLIVSLLAVALVFYVLGASFIAALEVIIYAGAIMVLFVFVVMMLNLGQKTVDLERQWLRPGVWTGPAILAVILIAEVAFLLITRGGEAQFSGKAVGPKEVAVALYQPYLIGVELASFLLMAGLVGAYHVGLRPVEKREEQHDADSHEPRSHAGGDLVRSGSDRAARAS